MDILKQEFDDYRALHAPFYCRTREMRYIEREGPEEEGALPLESSCIFIAYIKNGSNMWTVQEERYVNGEDVPTSEKSRWQDLTFFQAMQMLSYQEKIKLYGVDGSDPTHEAVGESLDELGMKHYIAYMERDGLMLDKKKNVRMRPHDFVLPANTVFAREDIDRANARWESKEISKQRCPVSNLPQMDLIDLFKTVAQAPVDADTYLSGKTDQRITVLQKFIDHLNQSFRFQTQYLNEYRELDKGHLMQSADSHLKEAEKIVAKDFKEAQIPYQDKFALFVNKRQIDLKLLHATVLKTLTNEGLHKNKADRVSQEEQMAVNRKRISAYVTDIQKTLRRMGSTPEKIEAVPQVILQTEPTVSPWLEWIRQDFEKQREAVVKAAQKNEYLPEDEIIPRLIRVNREDARPVSAPVATP